MWRTIYFVLWQELLVLGWPYSILHSVCKTINVELNKSFFPGFEKSLSTRSKYEPPPDLMPHILSRLFKPRKISFSSFNLQPDSKPSDCPWSSLLEDDFKKSLSPKSQNAPSKIPPVQSTFLPYSPNNLPHRLPPSVLWKLSHILYPNRSWEQFFLCWAKTSFRLTPHLFVWCPLYWTKLKFKKNSS